MQRDEFEVVEDEMPEGRRRLALHGELDMVSSPELSARLEELGRSGTAVRIDLTGVTFMDSTGVRTLYAAAKRAEDGDASLEIVPPTGAPWRVLEITGLHRILPFVN
jgi:anti-sigma B factor antagonist